jgi:hypothetical protein
MRLCQCEICFYHTKHNSRYVYNRSGACITHVHAKTETEQWSQWYLHLLSKCYRIQTHAHSLHLIPQDCQGLRARVMYLSWSSARKFLNFQLRYLRCAASTLQLSPTQHTEAAPSNRLSKRSRKANVSNKFSSRVSLRLSLLDPILGRKPIQQLDQNVFPWRWTWRLQR